MQANGRGFLVALSLILLLPAFSGADLAAKPDAYTEKDRLREKLEYNHKTLVDPYRSIGNKNPRWDAEALKFLESSARHFGSAGFGALYVGDAPAWPELIELGKAAIEKGCDDPMVLYCYGAFLIDSQRTDEGNPVLRQAYKGLLASKYPPERIMYAAKRMLSISEDVKERLDVTKELEKLRVKVLAIKFVNSAHRRAMAQNVWEQFPDSAASNRGAFLEEMQKNKEADQWIVNLLSGKHFIDAAWDARGGGWANQVKAEGWRGFEENLSRARECLTAAWKMAPNLPEAPTEMITVTMGQGNRRDETLRTWFDRAVEAQFDYYDAYHTLRYALLPRWHGTHEEILALGIECYRTGRYDTLVPYQLVKSMERIRDDRAGDMSLWDQPEMYDMLREVMLKYAEQYKAKDPDNHAWYLSYAAALANRNGRHEDARKLLDEIGDKVVEDRYWEMRQLPKISVSESYLLTGPFAKRVKEALDLQKTEKHEQAVEAITRIMEEMPRDDKGRLNAQYHLELSQRSLKLASGDWVDLKPGVDRVPWQRGPGAWSVPNEGELMGIADQHALGTIAQLVVPQRYELSAQIEIKKMDEIRNPGAGMMINFTGWQMPYPGVWVYPRDKKMLTRGKEDEWHDINCGDTFSLAVKVLDDRATVLLDGKEVAEFGGVGRPPAQRRAVGLSGMYQMPQGTVVFREMKIRRLEGEG